MKDLQRCVPLICLLLMTLFQVEGNSPGLHTLRLQGRSQHSNLATSRLYIPDSISQLNRTQHHRVERYPQPADWHCDSIVQWRDLGESHFPRFVKHILCAATQCYNRFFSCVPQYYPLTVLKQRDREITSNEMALPPQLRSNWMIELVHVSVGCVCGE